MPNSVYKSPQEACHAIGVDFDGTLPDYGQNRRLNVSGDPRGAGDANIYAFPDGNGGCVTNFKTGQRVCWYSSGKSTVRMQKRHGQTNSHSLLQLWHAATVVKSHPYYEMKCIHPNKRIRQTTCEQIHSVFNWAPWDLQDPLLCVPLSDGPSLVSMQFIDVGGQKRFLKGHKTRGAYWFTSKRHPDKALGIAEGIATAISVAEVNKFPVVAAMSSGNLLAVAEKMRSRYPNQEIYILSDVGNGEKDAQLAAWTIGAMIAKPTFTPKMLQFFQGKEPTDFNDFYRCIGELK